MLCYALLYCSAVLCAYCVVRYVFYCVMLCYNAECYNVLLWPSCAVQCYAVAIDVVRCATLYFAVQVFDTAV
jgi:hypothetical protein